MLSAAGTSPGCQVGAALWVYGARGRTEISHFALDAGTVDELGVSLDHVAVDHVDFRAQLHHIEDFFEMIDFDSLANGIFLQFGDGDATWFFADEGHEVVLFGELFALVLFLHVRVEHPDVDIFAFGSFDAFNEVVGGELLQDFVEEIGREFGAMGEIFFCGGVFLDEGVDSAVTVTQDGVEYPVNAFLLLLHSNKRFYKRIGNNKKWVDTINIYLFRLGRAIIENGGSLRFCLR